MANPSNDTAGLSATEKRELVRQLLAAKAGAPRPCSLSYGQRALWFLYQLAPKSPAYNVMHVARIPAELDVAALVRAVRAVVGRHSILSTTYRSQHGVPVQQADPQSTLDFEAIECAGMSSEDLQSRLHEEADRPFDLEQGPVLRVRLFTRPAEDHLLLLAIHHIAVDFWSLGVVVDELRECYAAECAGRPATLPPPGLQFVDYVHWQEEMLAGPEGERLWAYWQRQLAGELPVLQLPSDRPRPQVQTYGGAMQDFPLSQELALRVLSLAKAEGVTPYMIFLATFAVLLYRYTGQTDVLIGSPVAGRSRPELERVVGYFSNPVVLRQRLSSDLTPRELLAQVRDTVLAAIEHQDYPFPLLVERLQPVRDPSYSPLFQVAFMWDKTIRADQPADVCGKASRDRLELQTVASEQRGSAFDLALTVFEVEQAFSARFQFNTDIFDSTTIARIARNYLVLLESILRAPEERISRLPLLASEERSQLLVQWNQTYDPYPDKQCVHELFERQARESPGAVALVFDDEHLTYRELNQRSNRLAHRLRGMGVGPEALVGICVERGAEMVIALLGVLKAGGAYVPLDPTYPKDRLAFMLDDARPAVLLTQEHLLERLPSDLAKVIFLDKAPPVAPESDEDPKTLTRPNNLVYVIYTSGSTGKPKGVEIPHRALVNLLTSMGREPGLTSGDVFFAVTSLSFDIAALEIFLPLISGARLVVASRDATTDGTQLVKRMLDSGATAAQATPATWQLMLDSGWQASPQLRMVLCGGESLRPELARRLLQKCPVLFNLYGPTETTVWSAVRRIANADEPITIGHPIANTQLCVLDSWLQPVPIGVPGELYIGGAGLARGYHKRPDLTAEKFVSNPLGEILSPRLYRTGDLARFLSDGNIEFLGRLDRQVKVSGHRIELGEIETAIRRHPAVREAVVVAREEAAGNRLLVAYVVVHTCSASPPLKPPAGEGNLTVNDLRQFLKEMLPLYMMPSAFVFLNALPLTANRKVDYKGLPPPGNARPKLEQDYAPPRNPLEEKLAAICAEILELQAVGIHDNFFDIGGTSLRAIQIVAKANEARIPLRPEMLFENQTIAELGAALAGSAATL